MREIEANLDHIVLGGKVQDVKTAAGQSVVDSNGVATLPQISIPVVDVQNAAGSSVVDSNGIAHIPADLVKDVRNSQGQSLVSNGIATIPAIQIPVTDVRNSQGQSVVVNGIATIPAVTIPVTDVIDDETGQTAVINGVAHMPFDDVCRGDDLYEHTDEWMTNCRLNIQARGRDVLMIYNSTTQEWEPYYCDEGLSYLDDDDDDDDNISTNSLDDDIDSSELDMED